MTATMKAMASEVKSDFNLLKPEKEKSALENKLLSRHNLVYQILDPHFLFLFALFA